MSLRLLLAAAVTLAALAALPNASAIPPVCIEREHSVGPFDSHVGQCGPQSATLDLCEGDGTATGHNDGFVIVEAETCPEDPCDGLFGTGLVLGVVGVALGPWCQVVVSVDLVDCTWQEAWGAESYGPVTLRQTHCVDGT